MTMQPISDDMVTTSKICVVGRQVRMGPYLSNPLFFMQIIKK